MKRQLTVGGVMLGRMEKRRKPMAPSKFSVDSALKALEAAAKESNKDLLIAFRLGPGGGWSVSLGSQERRTHEHLAYADTREEALRSAVDRYSQKQSERGAIRSTKSI